MLLRFKYFLIVILFIGFIPSETDGCPDKDISTYDERVANIIEDYTSDYERTVKEISALMCQNMAIIDNDFSQSQFRIHSHLLCGLKKPKQLLRNSLLSYLKPVADIFIPPLRYYIYTLEKIVI